MYKVRTCEDLEPAFGPRRLVIHGTSRSVDDCIDGPGFSGMQSQHDESWFRLLFICFRTALESPTNALTGITEQVLATWTCRSCKVDRTIA